MKIPPDFGTVVPYLFVSNASQYIDFLTAAFGGVEIGRSVTDDGRIAHCQIRIGTTTIMISEAQDGYPPSKSALYIFVDDADKAMKHALDCGADHEMDVADMSYGDRQGGVRDPSGNIWWISQRLVAGGYF